MSDQNFNFKSFKPTMKPPSEMGKKIDSGFKSKMRNVGVNMNSIKENNIPLNEKEESLKKKIFSLPKMETLVMTDEYLSNIYNKLKQDAQETYGYHWNETIMNILFNEYVLDDVGYLQKYKNTKTYNKKRRGQEGVEELEKELQNKVAKAKANKGDEPILKRDKKVSDVDSNKDNLDKFKRGVKQDKENNAMANESQNEVAEKMKILTEGLDKEMNELFGFGAPAPMTSHKASKNDTYFVDKGNNTAVGVISTNLTPEQNQETANKFAGNTLKYSRMPWFVAVQNKIKGVPQQVTDGSIADFQQDAVKYAGVPALGETTGAASSGAYAPALDNQDNTYQNETTTSASSGAFSGPFPAQRKSVLDKPLWVGGTILKESKDYLGNPEAFKKYIEHVESVDKLEEMLNESVDEGSLSMKQHAQNVLNNLNQMTIQNPEVAKLPEFQETLAHWKELALTGQAPNPQEHPQQVSEDHLSTKEEKIDFIVKNSQGKWNSFPMAYTPEQLLAMTDEQVDQIYHTIEHEAGVNENEVDEMFGFGGGGMGSRLNVGSSPSSLKGAGSPQLTKLRGDMRDKMFATNLSGYKNHVINALRHMPSGDKVIGALDKIYDQFVETNMKNSVSPEETARQVSNHWSGVAESKASNRISNRKIHINEEPSFKDAMVKDISYSRGKASDSDSVGELESKDGLFKGKWNNNENINEKSVSKAQQKFMGMVHADQKGELENPSPAVKKAASSMTDKAATDYASTKQAGLPNYVDEKDNNYLMGWPNKGKMITPKENPFDKVQFADNSKHTASDENIFTKIAKLVFPDPNPNQTPESLNAMGEKFVHDFFGTMPPERVYDLLYKKYQKMNLAENKTINHADYKEFFKNKLKASGKSLGSMSPEEKESFFAMVDTEYQSKGEAGVQESMVDDQPDSMARTMDSPELNVSGAPTGGSSAPVAEAAPEVDVEDRESDQGDRQSKEANADAAKFREFLKSNYGVESVAELSPRQKQQVMKDMDAAKAANAPAEEKPSLDLKNFAATDADKASYQARDNQQLSFVAQNNEKINTIQDYLALEKQYTQERGEKMFHPMAILASIQAMPPQERAQFNNVERVLTTQMKGGNVQESKQKSKQNNMNEERMSNSMLNLQKIQKETASIATKQMADADALKQAKVYPNPDEFYIEQDKDKIQEFKTGEELEKEALAKMEELKALENVGDSTGGDSTSGNNAAPKRNLTKEEKLRLAMDRGDGMHNIVYDNKPSEKFEKRLQKDMGEDQYKLRQEKINYREDMPSYNKDTQPVMTGEVKAQDTKFKKGYNEAFTGKYTNDYGKSKLVEFQLEDTEEVTSINEGSFLLTLEGLGNKYTQKINESKIFGDVVKDYDFYLSESKVIMIKRDPNGVPPAPTEPELISETIMDKMNHLIGYSTNEFVNTKKSVRF
jgi:hypothetical protein